MQKTRLGWIATGPVAASCATSIQCHVSRYIDLQEVAKLWEIEEYSNKNIFSQEEAECELYFSQTCTRNTAGKFVKMPLKEHPSVLGESYPQAL